MEAHTTGGYPWEGMKTRSQVFTLDLVIGAVLFLIALLSVLYLWDRTITNIQNKEDYYEMEALANSATDQLVRTTGSPYNWTRDTVTVYGLVNVRMLYGSLQSQDRVIDPDKLLDLVYNTKNHYKDVKNQLIGVGKYHLYFEITCLNQSRTDCFNALSLDSVTQDVACNNPFTFTVDAVNHMTDSNTWIEAEDAYGNPRTDHCSHGCSNNLAAGIDISGKTVTLQTTPGLNNIWIRLYDDSPPLTVRVNNKETILQTTHKNAYTWVLASTSNLTTETSLTLISLDKLVDVVFITTNLGYNPAIQNPPYGNPHYQTACLAGEYEGDKGMIVASEKTATFAKKQAGQTAANETFRIKAVVWTEPLIKKTTSTTTSTIPAVDISCTPTAPPDCSINKAVQEITSIDVAGPLICNQPTPVTVQWLGKHNDDPNYWSFFVTMPVGGYQYLDSCTSYYADSQTTNYTMSCTVNTPDVNLLNGTYTLTVTADDGTPTAGGCRPDEPDADALQTTAIELRGCRESTPLACVSPVPLLRPPNVCSNESIHTLEIDAPDNSPYNTWITAKVWWSGFHQLDNYTYFGFFLDDVGSNIGNCKSEVREDSDPSYYEMDCLVWLSPSVTLGIHTIIVTANDNYGYCNSTSNINANDVIDIT